MVTMNTGVRVDRMVLKWTGRPIYVEELVHALLRVLRGESRVEVLEHGV